jgi:hypothetical protein
MDRVIDDREMAAYVLSRVKTDLSKGFHGEFIAANE